MRKLSLVSLFVFLNLFTAQAADDTSVELGKIVITPLRGDETIAYIPASIAVIEKEEIEAQSASGIVDVLNYQAGLTTRDYYGNGAKASVDIRGFGETAGMNTLVLVDGRRTNEVDLSGADWTQIPLDRIERIEIIKGPASTLYGDNAMGGVINIITKKGTTEKPHTTLQVQSGSYDLRKEKILVEGLLKKKASYSLNHTHYSTNGYRQNSAYASDDFGGKLTYDINDNLGYSFNSNYHKANFGLPGALRESQLRALSRKQSMFPNDKVKEEDWYVDNGISTKLFGFGVLDASLSLRQKEVNNLLVSSQHLDNRDLNTLGITAKYTFDKEIFDQLNKFILGYDFYKTGTSQDDYSYLGLSYYSGGKTRTTNIDKSSQGFFVQDELKLFKKLTVSGGYRYEKALYNFGSWPHQGPWTSDMFWMPALIESKLKVDEDAANIGVNYAVTDNAWVFANLSKSFRFPATDEYYSIWSTPPVNASLLPQKAKSYEVGARFDLWSKATISVTGFLMNIQNELFYNPLTFANENYSKTKHQGVEFDTHVKLTKILNLSAFYTYMDAIFKDGTYQGNQIPAVPHHKASIGIEALLPKGFKAGIFGNYVGARYFISDPSHLYPKMKEYFTLDTKLTYEYKNASIFFGVNNLLNERYSEYGVISLMSAEPGYYPSPERNWIAGVTLKF